MPQKFLTLEGDGDNLPKKKKTIADIMGIALDQDNDDTLGRFRFRRAFTPPARVRRALQPPKAVKKAVRYAGAAAFTFGMPFGAGLFMGKQRNKMFGLKGSEQKSFDSAAKVGRIVAIAAVSIAGVSAISGAMSSSAAAKLAAAKQGGMLTKGSSFLMKDPAGQAFWKITTDVAGQVVGQKFNKSQAPGDYADLPNDSTPIPMPNAAESSNSLPPTVAGAGPTASQGISEDESMSEDPQESLLGQARRAVVDRNNPMEGNDIPGVNDSEEESADRTPSQGERSLADVAESSQGDETNDDTSIFSMMNKGKEDQAEAPKAESDGSVSLGSIIQAGRAQMMARRRKILLRRRGWRGGLRADLSRQEQVQNLLGVD